jgi:hypothetical protein
MPAAASLVWNGCRGFATARPAALENEPLHLSRHFDRSLDILMLAEREKEKLPPQFLIRRELH